MPETYFVECACRNSIPVELYEAGTEKHCSLCGENVTVPNSTVLKESSGDMYPLLSPWEKVLRTAATGEAPFSGICHGCGKQPATFQVPIYVDVLVERHVADGNGIRPTITGGIKLVAAETQELRKAVSIPLLLCEPCHEQFRAIQARDNSSKRWKSIGMVLLLIAFLGLAYYSIELVAALSGILSVIGAIAWVMTVRNTQQIDSSVLDWAKRIRWMPEALASHPEFNLEAGEAIPFVAAHQTQSQPNSPQTTAQLVSRVSSKDDFGI